MGNHFYLGIELLTIGAAHKQVLVDALKRLGRQDGNEPCKINHWRIRPDHEAIILEAEWGEDEVTVAAIVRRLEALYELAPGSVTASTQQTDYGPVVTLRTGVTNRMRLIAFGGVDADWGTSLQSAARYISDNKAEWESES